MDPTAYLAMQNRVELLARLLLDTDPAELTAFIQAGEHSDAFAPFVDPTAWARGHATLRMVIAHATAISLARESIAEAAELAGAIPAGGR